MGEPIEGDGGGGGAPRRGAHRNRWPPSRRPSCRAGRGRQFRGCLRARKRCGGVCAGAAVGAACTASTTSRRTHRRGPVARRGQLHGPDDQSHCSPTGSGPRRPDRAFRRDLRDGRRATPGRGVGARAWHPRIAGPTPARASGSALPSGPVPCRRICRMSTPNSASAHGCNSRRRRVGTAEFIAKRHKSTHFRGVLGTLASARAVRPAWAARA